MKTIEQRVKEREDQGRNFFNDWVNTHPEMNITINKWSENNYTHWDVSFYSGETKVIGEIKKRDYNHNSFNEWVLEVKKLKYLQELGTKHNCIFMYINITKDNQMMIWNLSDLNWDEMKQDKIITNKVTVDPNKGQHLATRYFLSNDQTIYKTFE